MRVLALDLSLTGTGWATSIDDYGTETKPGKLRGVERLHAWQDWLIAKTTSTRFDLAVIEGYAMGARGRAVFSIGEWGGISRLSLYQMGIPYVEIAPSTLKKYATGKGNAPKPDMRMALYKRTGLDVSDDNAVDAIWLLAAAYQQYGEPLFDVPKAQSDALSKPAWPEGIAA